MSEDHSFADWWLAGMLEASGWPKQRGVLRKSPVMSAAVVDQLREGLVRIGVGLGAGRPLLAAQLLGDVFDQRDWTSQPLSELIAEILPVDDWSVSRVSAGYVGAVTTDAAAPWERMVELRFAQHDNLDLEEVIDWEVMSSPAARVNFNLDLVRGLLWGLLHPDEARGALDAWSGSGAVWSEFFAKHGMTIPVGWSFPSREEEIRSAADFVDGFCLEKGPLTPLSPVLVASPEIVHRMFEDDESTLEAGRRMAEESASADVGPPPLADRASYCFWLLDQFVHRLGWPQADLSGRPRVDVWWMDMAMEAAASAMLDLAVWSPEDGRASVTASLTRLGWDGMPFDELALRNDPRVIVERNRFQPPWFSIYTERSAAVPGQKYVPWDEAAQWLRTTEFEQSCVRMVIWGIQHPRDAQAYLASNPRPSPDLAGPNRDPSSGARAFWAAFQQHERLFRRPI